MWVISLVSNSFKYSNNFLASSRFLVSSSLWASVKLTYCLFYEILFRRYLFQCLMNARSNASSQEGIAHQMAHHQTRFHCNHCLHHHHRTLLKPCVVLLCLCDCTDLRTFVFALNWENLLSPMAELLCCYPLFPFSI